MPSPVTLNKPSFITTRACFFHYCSFPDDLSLDKWLMSRATLMVSPGGGPKRFVSFTCLADRKFPFDSGGNTIRECQLGHSTKINVVSEFLQSYI